MIVHRFMSTAELKQLAEGKVLRNHTRHKDKRRRTTSFGFCFFTEDPKEAIHWLSGCIDPYWCVTLEVPDDYLIETWGMYCDNDKVDYNDNAHFFGKPMPMIKKKEYCRAVYSTSHPGVKFISATDDYKNYCMNRRQTDKLIRDVRAGRIDVSKI